MCITNTIINYLNNFQSTPFLSIYLKNRWNCHYIIYTFWFLLFLHVCVLHPFMGALYIQFIFSIPPPYSWGIIKYCTMNTGYDIWLSFIITIWLTLKINKTCGISFSSWIFPTYYCIFQIISGYNITPITICLLIFWIINISTFFLVWHHSNHHGCIFFCCRIIYIYMP